MDTIDKIKSEVKKRISIERFQHSLRVADTAKLLQKRWGGNLNKLLIAALLHDIARDIPANKLIEIAVKNNYTPDEVELDNPILLHAPVGAIIAEKEFNINDKDILNCIKYHTTGRKNITLNEAIIYVSDFIEPGRAFPDAEKVRKIAFDNLTDAVIEETYSNVCYLMKIKKPIHVRTIDMFDSLLKKQLTETKIKI